jgi:Arc/MetJ-type ribon-helix-helix transcriptional regulator
MMIHLPKALKSSIEAAVHNGHFASVDDAMAEAARLLVRNLERALPPVARTGVVQPPDRALGSIGAMHEDAELLDEIVADAYRRRREDKRREFDLRIGPSSTQTSTPKSSKRSWCPPTFPSHRSADMPGLDLLVPWNGSDEPARAGLESHRARSLAHESGQSLHVF